MIPSCKTIANDPRCQLSPELQALFYAENTTHLLFSNPSAQYSVIDSSRHAGRYVPRTELFYIWGSDPLPTSQPRSPLAVCSLYLWLLFIHLVWFVFDATCQ